MGLSQSDRLAFSLAQVQAAAQISAINTAKGQVQTSIDKFQALDDGNKNLFLAPNALVNQYQTEFSYLDSNVRTQILEQDIQDSANRKLQNHFFPNDTSVTVPPLAAQHNVWVRVSPFALTYAQGLNYTLGFAGSTQKEGDLITAVQALITSAATYMDIELTSGQHCTNPGGTCSIPMYVTQVTCEGALPTPGIWTPGVDTIASFPAVVTLKSDLVTAVNNLITFLNTEVASIVTTDKNTGNQTQNNAAIANINTTLIPALNAWLAQPDFNPVPGSVTTCVQFYSYDPNLLAPTKLHGPQLAALQTALTNRSSFIPTRITQLGAILGSITQDLSDGSITASSGIYGQRYGFLSLRLNILTGSLTQLNGLKNTTGAQAAIADSIAQNKNTYYSIIPTSALQGPGNGTATLSLVDVTFIAQGDVVYLAADNQPEIVRGIKSINGKSVVLSDVVPPQYSPATNGRLYKDLT